MQNICEGFNFTMLDGFSRYYQQTTYSPVTAIKDYWTLIIRAHRFSITGLPLHGEFEYVVDNRDLEKKELKFC